MPIGQPSTGAAFYSNSGGVETPRRERFEAVRGELRHLSALATQARSDTNPLRRLQLEGILRRFTDDDGLITAWRTFEGFQLLSIANRLVRETRVASDANLHFLATTSLQEVDRLQTSGRANDFLRAMPRCR